MARIMGVDLPKDKCVEIGLTKIYGVGLTRSNEILKKVKIEPTKRVKELTEQELLNLRDALSEYILEGDLKRQVNQNIRRLHTIACYRGQRHKRKLPCRGQRTHTNARTKRGRKIAIAGKKKVTK